MLVRFPRSPLRCFESAHKAKRVSSAFNVQIWKVAIAKPLIARGWEPARACEDRGTIAIRCFCSAALDVPSPCSVDVGEVRATVDNRRQKLPFLLLIIGMCETSAPAFRRIIQAQPNLRGVSE